MPRVRLHSLRSSLVLAEAEAEAVAEAEAEAEAAAGEVGRAVAVAAGGDPVLVEAEAAQVAEVKAEARMLVSTSASLPQMPSVNVSSERSARPATNRGQHGVQSEQ